MGVGTKEANPDNGKSDNSRKAVAIVTGLTAFSVSIALFIISSNNKKKAEGLSFRMENAPVIQQGGFIYHSYPALSFRLNL